MKAGLTSINITRYRDRRLIISSSAHDVSLFPCGISAENTPLLYLFVLACCGGYHCLKYVLQEFLTHQWHIHHAFRNVLVTSWQGPALKHNKINELNGEQMKKKCIV